MTTVGDMMKLVSGIGTTAALSTPYDSILQKFKTKRLEHLVFL